MNAALRQRVRERAFLHCEYCLCREDFSPDSFSVDHIVPQCEGGSDALENLAFSCQGCNRNKYKAQSALDPDSGEQVALFHPRNEIWASHFRWGDDFSTIVGVSPTGRATIEKLQLNRGGVRNIRRALLLFGEHPAQTEFSP